MMRNVMAAGFALAVAGCASRHDESSRQVVSVSHLSTPPVGSLSVSSDSAYEFLDFRAQSALRGRLTESEFAALNVHTNQSALRELYAHAESDSSHCDGGGDGYLVTSVLGTACFVVSAIADSQSRAHLEFLASLLSQKAHK